MLIATEQKKKGLRPRKTGQPGAERGGSGRFAAKLMLMRRIQHKGSGGKKNKSGTMCNISAFNAKGVSLPYYIARAGLNGSEEHILSGRGD
jgi:hypothetical protein